MKKDEHRPDDLVIELRFKDHDFTFPAMNQNYWLDNDPVKTHFINALQGTFPEGERFFIDAARDTVEILRDEGKLDHQLEEDFKMFMSQEGVHSLKHSRWTQSLVEAGYEKMSSYDEMLKKLRFWFRRHFSAKSRIAMTAGAEHYTASLAWLLMYVQPELMTQSRSPFKEILLYHSMEEVEHKSVCFDLYQKLSGGYFSRTFWFLFISLDIAFHTMIRYRHLMKKDNLWDWQYKKKTWLFFFGKEGILRGMWPRIRTYLRPSFHPWNIDERQGFEQQFGDLREELGIPSFTYSQ